MVGRNVRRFRRWFCLCLQVVRRIGDVFWCLFLQVNRVLNTDSVSSLQLDGSFQDPLVSSVYPLCQLLISLSVTKWMCYIGTQGPLHLKGCKPCLHVTVLVIFVFGLGGGDISYRIYLQRNVTYQHLLSSELSSDTYCWLYIYIVYFNQI